MPDRKTQRPSVVFDVETIEGTRAQLAVNGVAFDKPLAEIPWGKLASFLDTQATFGLRE